VARLAGETRTLVFFEAPHRIVETLDDLVSELVASGGCCCARVDQTHETIYRGKLSELPQQAAMTLISAPGRLHWCHGSEEAPSTVDSQPLKRAVELVAKSCRRGGSVDCGAIDRRIPEPGIRAVENQGDLSTDVATKRPPARSAAIPGGRLARSP